MAISGHPAMRYDLGYESIFHLEPSFTRKQYIVYKEREPMKAQKQYIHTSMGPSDHLKKESL